MQTTYHLKSKDVDDILIKTIRKQFHDDDDLIITVASEQSNNMMSTDLVERLAYLEKKYPPKQVTKDYDFNSFVDSGINL